MIGALRRLVPAVLLLLVVALAGCGGGDDKQSSDAAPAPAQTPAPEARTAGGCKQVPVPQPQKPAREKKPTAALDTSKAWSLKFATNCGDFTVRLDLETAPRAAASMVSLARARYFDGTLIHRIAPGFVIQGGDPSASGNGGPGYKTVDKPPSGAKYTHGVVAMAKAPAEKAGTGGSQFFVVTGADVGLPPDYAVLGKVTKGLRAVDRIGRLGDPNTEQPTEPVVIESVTVGSK
jgi:cyclophilin family peptidyl-prolyl cis-trans isomerase